MKIKVKNLGVLKQAEFELGDFTIICGENNTGKTYATYALFGFLFGWRSYFSLEIAPDKIKQLLVDGVVQIDIIPYIQESQNVCETICKLYTDQLSTIFASSKEIFEQAKFQIGFEMENISLEKKFIQTISSSQQNLFSLEKPEKSSNLAVVLLIDKKKTRFRPVQ